MDMINGLPAHALLVHAVVVLVPLAGLLTVLCAVWPAARRKLGFITPLVALVALIAVPLTTDAGEWLEHHVDRDPLVRAHTHLGDGLLPWVIGVFVVALAGWVLHRRGLPVRGEGPGAAVAPGAARAGQGRGAMVVTIALTVLALVGAVGSVVQVYRIGESGARAVWHDGFSQQPVGAPGGEGDGD